MSKKIELEVCEDCLTIEANGSAEVDPDAVERFETAWARTEKQGFRYANACREDCEGWFSWTPCEFCGATDGGTRHPAVLLKEA